MTHTPDEIKKGLELCIAGVYDCCRCSYHEVGNGDCVTDVKCDVLAYIQQLESDNAQQARCIENLTDKLNATNDALPRWISVKERLPEKCEFVLCIVRYGEDAWNHELGFVLINKWVHPGRSDGTVTHWMPLPEPPKKEDTNA